MQNYKAIHQFTPSVAFGDSVSNALIYTQKILHDLGFKSEIFICEKMVDIKFNHEVYHITQYKESEDNLLLYHYATYNECHNKIIKLFNKKILVYHNITPSHFFEKNGLLKEITTKARKQLKNSSSNFIGSYGDSEYNCKELKYFNYPNPIVLPILLDLENNFFTPLNDTILDKYRYSYNILFVGRVVTNKAQHQLIDTLFQLKQKGINNIKLFIVGGISEEDYFIFLKRYAKNLNIENSVIITNKVTNIDLVSYYKIADLYLSLSEHEGFGMPLIEAMRFDIPVLAYNVGGVNSTVPNESLLEKKSPIYVANKIIELQENPYFRVEILKKQKEYFDNFSYKNIKNRFINYLKSLNISVKEEVDNSLKEVKTKIQIEGPFDTSYSLAIVNRTVAKALNQKKELDIKLYSTEGYGDFNPNLTNIDLETKTLFFKELKDIDITIRNLYPPRTDNMQGYHKIIGPYGWEETKFPELYIELFNKRLTMLFSMSSYVKKVLRDNGLYTPIVTTGIVADNILKILSKAPSFNLPLGFRLLHISSAFPRKGLDLLLEVFDTLENSLNISLIIKTFPNPHNKVLDKLDLLRYKAKIEYQKNIYLYTKEKKKILLINRDIPQSQIRYLYENSNLLVAPSFGEGFGLPIAEAMLLNLPVLTTAYGGQSDFCTSKTSWLIDFNFQYAKTHINLKNSLWAVPKKSSLKEQILYIYNLSKDKIDKKCKIAKEYVQNSYSSEKVAENILNAVENYPITKPKNIIGLFSTYNTKCGIAIYSKYLTSSFSDEVTIFANKTDDLVQKDTKRIIRCWQDGRETKNIENLKLEIINNKITKLIIQYNFSFISLKALEELLLFCYSHKIETHLFLHSTKDVITPIYIDSFKNISSSLQKSTRIYLHRLTDINYLKNFGIYKNTTLFTHGINTNIQGKEEKAKNSTPILATFGFLLPQKGIFELIDIAEILHKKGIKVKLLLLCAIHPAPISKELEIVLKDKILKSFIKDYITLNSNFLEEKEIINKLSKADKIIFLYKDTQESSSAAVRVGLLALKEVITTPLAIFDDVKEVVTQPKNKEYIINTIINSLNKPYDNRRHKEYLKENSWQTISKLFFNILKG